MAGAVKLPLRTIFIGIYIQKQYCCMVLKRLLSLILYLCFSLLSDAQQVMPSAVAPATDTSQTGVQALSGNVDSNASGMQALTLKDCIAYAFKNQPALNQSYIDEVVAHVQKQIATSSYLPQINGAVAYDHYFQLPTVFTPLNGTLTAVHTGLYNTGIPAATASQNIFSPDVLLASRTARLGILGARQNTTSTKIDLVSDISKAFYDLLLSLEQTGVYKEDTARLIKNRDDAYYRYQSGVVDKVDYKQASIALNNSMAQLKTATEAVSAKYAALQQLMGFPPDKKFTVRFDTTQMMQDVYADTTVQLQFERRIEYQQLQTAKRILRETTMYYHLGWLPTLSAFYQYDYEYEDNTFSHLLNHAYPYSFFGVQLSVPIFTGFKRVENVHKAKLEEKRADWDEIALKLQIFAEYRQALASYKGNLYFLHTQSENTGMAREVYDIVKLQYREGIKTYLDVIVAESDLQTSEINYLNALFQLLQSKIDLERAMGNIPAEI